MTWTEIHGGVWSAFDGRVVLCEGDAVDVLSRLPDGSVHCVVTSPPYWAMRDYEVDGQIGSEDCPFAYVRALVRVFRGVRRVLRDDGTVWLVLGDTYCSTAPGTMGDRLSNSKQHWSEDVREARRKYRPPTPLGMKPKDLVGIPWQVAFALRDDGWHLRQDIIWHKTNCTPESVKDRCTKSHEYIFLLSKQPRYYFDYQAIQEPATGRDPGNKTHKHQREYETSNSEQFRTKAGLTKIGARTKRRKRTVWSVSTAKYRRAHFAVFPPKLIEPCVLAGCPPGGVVLDPFIGSGTTAVVALQHERACVGIELKAEYLAMAREGILAAVPA